MEKNIKQNGPIGDAIDRFIKHIKHVGEEFKVRNTYFINEEKKTVTLRSTLGTQIVKCHEEDVFDEKIGMALARERLGRKVFKKTFGCLIETKEANQKFLREKLGMKDYCDYYLSNTFDASPYYLDNKITELKEKGLIKYVGKKVNHNEQ